jgi:hypothetical protein
LSTPARVGWLIALSVGCDVLVGTFESEKLQFLLKDALKLNASGFATVQLVVGTPAYLRVFMGIAVDAVPFFGYQRKSYYLISWALAAAAAFLLAIEPRYTLASTVAAVTMLATGGNLMYVVTDAVLVRTGNATGTTARLQAIQQGVPVLLGATFVGPLSGFVTQHWTYHSCFLAAAAFALAGTAITLVIDEQRATRTATADIAKRIIRKEKIAALLQAARNATFWLPVAFVFYLIVTPGTGAAQFYYSVDAIHLSKQDLGNLRIPGSVGSIIAVALFAAVRARLSVVSIAWVALACECLGSLISLGLLDVRSAYVVAFLQNVDGQFTFLLLITLAARACPKDVEATFYALAAGIIVLGETLSNKMGAAIYDLFVPKQGWLVLNLSGLLSTLIAGAFVPLIFKRKRSESVDVDRTELPSSS